MTGNPGNPNDWPTAWSIYCAGTPREDLTRKARIDAEAAVGAGVARWAPVGGIWRLRWNFPTPKGAR